MLKIETEIFYLITITSLSVLWVILSFILYKKRNKINKNFKSTSRLNEITTKGKGEVLSEIKLNQKVGEANLSPQKFNTQLKKVNKPIESPKIEKYTQDNDWNYLNSSGYINLPPKVEEVDKIRCKTWIEDTINSFDETHSLIELIIDIDIYKIKYSDILSCVEWKLKRLNILIRDKFTCEDCKVRAESNHVHHKYYIRNQLAWEIEDSALVTLCKDCHSKRHKIEKIKVYENQNGYLKEYSNPTFHCRKCDGSGYLPQYSHVQNGVCFNCNGNYIEEESFHTALRNLKSHSYSYKLGQKRNEYREYLRSICVGDYLNKIDMKTKEHTSKNISSNSVDDSLPF